MSKKKSIIIIVILAVLIGIFSVACFASFALPNSVKDYNSVMSLIGKGIDLSGGYYVVLTPEQDGDGTSDTDLIDRAMEVLRTRLDSKGYTEATISVQDTNKIRIEVPEVDNAQDVLEVIGSTGELTFKDSSGTVWLTGDDIDSAYAGYDDEQGYVCVLNFTAAGVTKFSNATKAISESSNKVLSIFLGDTEVSSPTVSSQITSQSAQIYGGFTQDQAQSIASVIESGRLPIDYSVSEARSISAKLGDSAINLSLIAGGIGILLIFILLIVLYRGLGLSADIALIIYALLYIITLALIPSVQLTLPGIAGILLSIGMAVDANVVIFERIKDEYSSGKMVQSAIKAGFGHALITVVDSNVTTVLAAIVLWLLCPGSIKGFAITLLVGIVLSMITSIFITRGFIKLFTPLAKKKGIAPELQESSVAKFLNLKREGGNDNV